jgi:hypothetical protein
VSLHFSIVRIYTVRVHAFIHVWLPTPAQWYDKPISWVGTTGFAPLWDLSHYHLMSALL